LWINSTFFYLLLYQYHNWKLMLKCINCLVNYGVVLLLGVVSLMVGTTMVYRYLLGMVGTNNSIRNNRLLHWALQVPHHPGSSCYPTEAPKYCATPRRHRSTTPRRHRHVKPRLQFTTLQPTFLQSTTTVMFQSTTPPRQPSITPLLTLIFTTPKIRTHHSAPSYYTTKAAKYYTANYDSAISKTKFLNTRATIFWGYLYLSVIFVVIGHWELIIDLKWENKSFTTCNYFVRLLLVTTSLSTMKD
jgi:hypothetical protein